MYSYALQLLLLVHPTSPHQTPPKPHIHDTKLPVSQSGWTSLDLRLRELQEDTKSLARPKKKKRSKYLYWAVGPPRASRPRRHAASNCQVIGWLRIREQVCTFKWHVDVCFFSCLFLTIDKRGSFQLDGSERCVCSVHGGAERLRDCLFKYCTPRIVLMPSAGLRLYLHDWVWRMAPPRPSPTSLFITTSSSFEARLPWTALCGVALKTKAASQ